MFFEALEKYLLGGHLLKGFDLSRCTCMDILSRLSGLSLFV